MITNKGIFISRVRINSSRNASLPSSGWKNYEIINLPPNCQIEGLVLVSAIAGRCVIRHCSNFDGLALGRGSPFCGAQTLHHPFTIVTLFMLTAQAWLASTG